MDELDIELQELVQNACLYLPTSTEQRKILNRLLRLLFGSGRIWNGKGIYGEEIYEEALQKTLIKISKICKKYKERYEADNVSLISYFNKCLKNKCKDEQKRASNRDQNRINTRREYNGEILDPLDKIISPIDGTLLVPIWEKFCQWIKDDPDGKLRDCYVGCNKKANCQAITYLRIIQGKDWSEIVTEVDSPRGSITSHYSRKCKCFLSEWLEKNQKLFGEEL